MGDGQHCMPSWQAGPPTTAHVTLECICLTKACLTKRYVIAVTL